MKLHCHPISPYARKAMILCRLHNLDVEEISAKGGGPRGYTEGVNPLGKIPALELADGRIIFDSPVVCEYLDGLSDAPLLPVARDDRIQQKVLHALGDGLSDAVYNYRQEVVRDKALHWDTLIERHTMAMTMGVEYLDSKIDMLGVTWSFGNIAIICALDYMRYRAPHMDWTELSPALADWHSTFQSNAAYSDSYGYPKV